MIDTFYKTLYHFFPHFSCWLGSVNDPRQKNKTTYSSAHLLWLGILLFLLKLGSRRQIKFLLDTLEFKNNLTLLTKSYTQKVAHPDTLENLLEKLKPQELSEVRRKMINRLLRMKCFVSWRLLGKYYLVSLDGTGHLVFRERHCQYCLTKKVGGKTIYYHHILEAKLVAENGLALSVETEFIENTGEDYKQDCELKAFYRLAKRLKKRLPQLEICLLLDSLYACSPVANLLKRYGWAYITTFKEGSMPESYAHYILLKNFQPENREEIREGEIFQEFSWVNDAGFGDHCFDVLECLETKPGKKGKIERTKFVWMTNIRVNNYNFSSIAKGGRLRWKIENEGFNMQKNGGYRLEHPYSQNEVAMKNFYLLLQIAHIINQLMEKGSLLREQIKKALGVSSISLAYFWKI